VENSLGKRPLNCRKTDCLVNFMITTTTSWEVTLFLSWGDEDSQTFLNSCMCSLFYVIAVGCLWIPWYYDLLMDPFVPGHIGGGHIDTEKRCRVKKVDCFSTWLTPVWNMWLLFSLFDCRYLLSVRISERNDGCVEAIKLIRMDSMPSFHCSHNSVAARPSRNLGI
jgi:hypothetical protein